MSVILVTGASNGFGRLSAIRLAREGHTVWAAMRGVATKNEAAASELRSLAESEGLALRIVEMDVKSTESVNAAVATVLGTEGRIDVLLNNAGILYGGPSEAFSVEQLQDILDTNLVGSFRVSKAVLPSMRANKSGLVLVTSSVFGRIPGPYTGLYNATKFGLEGLYAAMAYELRPVGVDTVLIEPGPFRTGVGNSGVMPADAHVLADYGATAAALEPWGKGFGEFLSIPMPETDPAQFAEAVSQLIALPAGERPLRKVVGIPYAADVLNAAAEPIERAMVDGQQLGFMITGQRWS